ncbi:GNAT family N-acetyltransferase [Peribacillus simplex]|uniref:GNAT family N-acetyltransferase n=1 Tax=Peribacillus simplex NBRC 15720 = DSM 1321 TaxID=1349754 RepID=A0A223EJW8_9BACI|nr:GNAT family N-acetyltransferase [Peribacillus simplex]ASS95541.1 GNAT family N-acetyltransferase [Peribacillus simplex NBRC 15720 = DSM 1321]MEC1398460.1 GNAT family N-acetyltransferase [Peribacillus simplex]
MLIREAMVADAEEIAIVHVDCWRTTYKNIISSDFLDKLSYGQRTELWKKNISGDGNYIYVAENNEGKIVGFISGGKRETNQVEDSGDLTAIYILENFQRMGIGKRLIKELFFKFEGLGFKTIFVEVLEDNKSRYIYEAFGAELLKTEKIKMAGAELDLLVYSWKDISPVLL